MSGQAFSMNWIVGKIDGLSELLSALNRSTSSYREIPTFGRDTIRQFSRNCSDMKKFAARDFEDMLQVSSEYVLPGLTILITSIHQCAIPVFEGLLPEPHNTRVLHLLFLAAWWHGLAKLRMHTESTLKIMENVTVSLGKKLREFTSKTCSAYNTRELQRETDARKRRQAKQGSRSQEKSQGVSQDPHPIHSTDPVDVPRVPVDPHNAAPCDNAAPERPLGTSSQNSKNDTRRPKTLNLNTYKTHSLGDYVSTIRKYGTTDSYSTEPVCTLNSSPGIELTIALG